MRIRVIAIEDHPLMLEAIVDKLSAQPDIEVAGTADHGSKLLSLVRETTPDVVILDLRMSTGVFEPVSAVRQLLQSYPGVRVLILTGSDDPVYIHELVNAGALGYILKSEDLSLELPRCIRAIFAGERFYSPEVMRILFSSYVPTAGFTSQEIQILRLVADGYQNARIGEALGVSEKRVRNILTDIYSKLGIREGEGHSSRIMAVNKAREKGILSEAEKPGND